MATYATTMLPTRHATIFAVLALPTVVSGCADASSSGGDELTRDNFAAEIGEAMQAAGSVHSVMTSPEGVGLTGEGDQQIGESRADSAMSFKYYEDGHTTELRVVDQVLYLNLGEVTENKFATAELSNLSDPRLKPFQDLVDQTNLTQQFDDFGDAITALEKTDESDRIDGVDAQAYRVTVDSKRLAKANGQDPGSMPDSFTYTFFVDDDHLVRRMSLAVAGAGITINLTDWGEQVTIVKPPSSQITDVDLASLFDGSA